MGFSPGLPPCREVLGSKHPTSDSPPLPTCSLGQGLLSCRAGLAARSRPGCSNIFIWYSPTVSLGEKSRGRKEKKWESKKGGKEKQEEKKDEEPAVHTACLVEPPRTELQLGSPKEPDDFNPATCCLFLQAWFLRAGKMVGEVR